jgi:hypothetical protein
LLQPSEIRVYIRRPVRQSSDISLCPTQPSDISNFNQRPRPAPFHFARSLYRRPVTRHRRQPTPTGARAPRPCPCLCLCPPPAPVPTQPPVPPASALPPAPATAGARRQPSRSCRRPLRLHRLIGSNIHPPLHRPPPAIPISPSAK